MGFLSFIKIFLKIKAMEWVTDIFILRAILELVIKP